jgi:hypothetical protein
MGKIFKLASAIGLLLSSTAYADTLNWNQHQGLYTEMNIGSNLVYLGVFSSGGNVSGSGFYGAGWSAALGYNITPVFSFETGIMQNYAKIKENNHQSVDTYRYRHLNVPYLTTRFDVALGERFSFIGKIGAMYASVPGKVSVVLPLIGLGAGYAVTPKVTATIQYQGAVYGIAGAGLMSAGLTYHFG